MGSRRNRRYRKIKRLKRRIKVYTMRAILALVFVGLIFLILWGGTSLFGLFNKEDAKDEKKASTVVQEKKDEEQITPKTEQIPDACVVLDAGHGGNDGGTVNDDYIEKDINLAVALKIQNILEENNIEVVMTRDSDVYVGLSERSAIANQTDADVFVSLHCNYYEDDAQIAGLECYYIPDAEGSKAYAESIVQAVAQSDRLNAREAREERYYVLEETAMDAVLIEMGFMSNDSECRKLASDSYQEILAEQIAEGIMQELKTRTD